MREECRREKGERTCYSQGVHASAVYQGSNTDQATVWQARECTCRCTCTLAPAVFLARHGHSNHRRLCSHSTSAVCSFIEWETYGNTFAQALSDTHCYRYAFSGSVSDFHYSPPMIATVIATAPASAPPPVKATTPSPTRKPRVSQRQIPVSTSSTGSPAVQPPSHIQQRREAAFLPLLVMGILSAIATFALLMAVGMVLLRKWLLPVRKVKLPPSGAAPWQRVPPTSLPGSINSSGSSIEPFSTTDASLPAARNSIPSRKGFPFPTSNGLPLEAQTKHE